MGFRLQTEAEQETRSVAAFDGSSAAAEGGEIDRSIQLSCGEHTDYGLLTLVNQDPDIPALQVMLSSSGFDNSHISTG
jgi:isopenicillin N synthase-like dioxygenase